jgi:hypothetical protein
VVALRIPPVGYQIFLQSEDFPSRPYLPTVVLPIDASAAQQVAITMIRHPFCASEMAIEGATCALRVAFGIDVKNDSGNFPPIGTVCLGIQEPEIGDDMLLVIGRQHGIIRCQVRNIGIKRG